MRSSTRGLTDRYSVPQNSFPLPTGSVLSFATLRKRLRRGNRYSILRNALDAGQIGATRSGRSNEKESILQFPAIMPKATPDRRGKGFIHDRAPGGTMDSWGEV